MIRLIISFICFCFALSAVAEPVYPTQIIQHRVAADGVESLLTPVARYVDSAGRTVDLVGAIHLADARYYRNLNRAFPRYDKVLYEMVDGEAVPEMMRLARKIGLGTATAEEKAHFENMVQQSAGKNDMFGNLLGRYYIVMSQMLDLQLQTESIDYSLSNMVFAEDRKSVV